MSVFVEIDGDWINRDHIVKVGRPQIQNNDTFSVPVVISTASTVWGRGFATEEAAMAWRLDLLAPTSLYREVQLFPRTEDEIVADMRRHVAAGGSL